MNQNSRTFCTYRTVNYFSWKQIPKHDWKLYYNLGVLNGNPDRTSLACSYNDIRAWNSRKFQLKIHKWVGNFGITGFSCMYQDKSFSLPLRSANPKFNIQTVLLGIKHFVTKRDDFEKTDKEVINENKFWSPQTIRNTLLASKTTKM